MYSEVAWVLVSSETQVQLQIILEPEYLPDYLSVSFKPNYGNKRLLVLVQEKKIFSKKCFGKIIF